MRPDWPNELTIESREGGLTIWRTFRFRFQAPRPIERFARGGRRLDSGIGPEIVAETLDCDTWSPVARWNQLRAIFDAAVAAGMGTSFSSGASVPRPAEKVLEVVSVDWTRINGREIEEGEDPAEVLSRWSIDLRPGVVADGYEKASAA